MAEICKKCKEAVNKLDQVKIRAEGFVYYDFIDSCSEGEHIAQTLLAEQENK